MTYLGSFHEASLIDTDKVHDCKQLRMQAAA